MDFTTKNDKKTDAFNNASVFFSPYDYIFTLSFYTASESISSDIPSKDVCT